MAAEAPPSAASASSVSAPRPPAASGSGGGAAASPESYIGSLISLTSKSEIRYEGVLYNINTEESSIGLRNVRSFGTEGRKKDGMQIPASDKVYEYILFRGSDIKDLQVKSSPPPPPPPQAASLHNDPAIIQSHYSQPASTSSLPSAGGTVVPDLSSQAAQYGLQRPSFQSILPLYQPGNTPWGSSVAPQAGNASTLSVPSMYWQGYYGHSSGLPPHLQPPPFLQPTPGLSVPQNLQYPSLPSGLQKLSELQPSLMPPVTSQGSSSGILPATTAPASATLLAPESSKPLLPNMGSLFAPPVTSLGATFPFPSQPTSTAETSAMSQNLNSLGSSKAAVLPGSTLAYQTVSQSVSSTVAPSSSSQVEMPVPLLAPSGQLLQNTASMLSSSHSMQTPLQMGSKESKPVEPKAKVAEPLLPDPLLPDPPSRALPENKEPILPLPKQTPQKVCIFLFLSLCLWRQTGLLFLIKYGDPFECVILC
ncbi:hypothetical protein PVAP13_5NG147200 [Panicum virgatum]|uniref:Sm domain-containing protein n=1 Tax=Panicum virgatum TaxID=38727 RepID=A0A8T0RPN6_PANVG|nr:hypothetical protein PVAP13_5NG147200 [Panicum virgatum]